MDGVTMKSRETILILGGARSGKSDYAQTLAGRLSSKVLYLATATVQDNEMAERVVKHRASRPATWGTLEAPLHLAEALHERIADYDVVLLDCLTMWSTNWLLSDEAHPDQVEQALLQDMEMVCTLCEKKGATLIVVSNEVGMGVVPPYALGRVYRDLLGRANQRLGRRADRVLLMVAGIPVDIKALAAQLPEPFRTEGT
jgi:adenosylcobinamide kinase / adenosylcobinamide-phosphate guanylyltransferase